MFKPYIWKQKVGNKLETRIQSAWRNISTGLLYKILTLLVPKDSIKLKEPDRVIRVGSFSLKSTDSIYLSVLWTTECASRKVLYLNDG